MMDRALRELKEVVLAPIAQQFGADIHPTTVTVISFAVGILSSIAAWQNLLGLGFALWLANRLLDGLDGVIARTYAKQSDFGGYLDILTDFVVYAAIPIGLVLRAPSIDLLIGLAFLLATFYVNGAAWMYLSALLEKRNLSAKAQGEMTSITMPTGIIEGSETVIFFSLFFLLPSLLLPLFVIMGVLTAATSLKHVLWAARDL
jgi:phosphatidylglycerophosphate synthase